MGPYNYFNPYEEEDPYGFGSDDINNVHQQNFFENMGGQGTEPTFYGGGFPLPQTDYTMPAPPPPVPQVQNPIKPTNTFDPSFNRVKQIADTYYTPQTAASAKFNELIDQFPQYEKPGIGRRIVAGLATLAPTAQGGRAGMAGANEILYGGYGRDLAAWKERAGPAQAAAQQENAQNVNERQLATQMANQVYNQEKAQETERTNKAKEKDSQDRTAILRYKAEHPDVKFYDNGTEIIMEDPIKGAVPTGVKGSIFGKMELEGLKTASNERIADTRAEASKYGADRRADSAETVQRMRNQGNATVQQMKIDAAKDYQEQKYQNDVGLKQTPASPAATAKEYAANLSNYLKELYATDKDARKHIIQKPDGTYDFGEIPYSWTNSSAANDADAAEYLDFTRNVLNTVKTYAGQNRSAPSARPPGGSQQQPVPSPQQQPPQSYAQPPSQQGPPSGVGPAYPTPGSPGIRRQPDGSYSGISFLPGQQPPPSQQAVAPQGVAPQVPQQAVPQVPQAAAPQIPQQAVPPPPQAAAPQAQRPPWWGAGGAFGNPFGAGGTARGGTPTSQQVPSQAPPQAAGGQKAPEDIVPGTPEWEAIWGTSGVPDNKPPSFQGAYGDPYGAGGPGTMGKMPAGSVPNMPMYGETSQEHPEASWITGVRNLFGGPSAAEERQATVEKQAQQTAQSEETKRQVVLTQKAIDYLNSIGAEINPPNVKAAIMSGRVK